MKQSMMVGVLSSLLAGAGFGSVTFAANIQHAIAPNPAQVTSNENGVALFSGDAIQFPTLSGEPAIPYRVVTLLLPPEADVTNVSVALKDVSVERVEGLWDVTPVPPLAASTAAQTSARFPAGKRIVDGRDAAVYGQDRVFPARLVGNLSSGRIRGAPVVQVPIALYQWNPLTKELFRVVGGRIVVSFGEVARSESMPEASDPVAERLLKQRADNFREIAPWYGFLAVPEEGLVAPGKETYAILTTHAIRAASKQLGRFIANKRAKGFRVKVITENEWGGGFGEVASNGIRAWLQSEYKRLNISYALFIGDANPASGDVPMKMLWPRNNVVADPPDYRQSPSDYFYADLTGKWDLDGDGRFGEGDDDMGPGGIDRNAEIIVGRLPYYGDIDELDAILSKINSYAGAPRGQSAWRHNVLLAMEPSDEYTPGYHLGEAIKDDFIVPRGWRYHRVYEQVYGLQPPPETIPTTIENVTDVWNRGKYGAVFWFSHGWSEGAVDIMDSIHAAYLNDRFPSFTFQASCHNAYPEDPMNLAYRLLANGGIATLGATRISWYFPGQTDFQGSAGNQGMTYEYAKRLIKERRASGDALYALKQELIPSGSELWMNYTDYNLYGDPSVGMFTFR